ncbi:MAG: shikimate dehydrogenase [Anaerolineae bacterium]|nr:shikimate dehydrogenase [Anaerolineae bacterium]
MANKKCVRVGLLGWPVGHSISPVMHNAAFKALGLNWRYAALAVPPGELEETVSWLITETGYCGFNVTIPHKRAVLALPGVAFISPAVRATGSANTLIVRPDGMLEADNTDWRGLAADLAAHNITVNGQKCLILGTGGSAQAVRYTLERLGAARITLVSRDPGGRDGVVGYDALADIAPEADVIVNCTPVGMAPDADHSPWPDGVPFPPHTVLYDLVYNPPVTRLMAQADAAGARVVGGLGMLVQQGALAFEMWTGSPPPVDVMAEAARCALSSLWAEAKP